MTTKSKERTKASGEVFTPRSLIREMLNHLPNAVWFDPNKRWLEPAAGDGNFLVEIKARLLQAGHDEIHILENMLFSVELIDDNHWALQHRLGYLIDGQPNPKLNFNNFELHAKISRLTQDLNDKNPYVSIGCARDEIIHHRNHVCASGLEYDMSFGRTDAEFIEVLEVLDTRDLGAWPDTDTPDVGERYVVERMLGKQPNLSHEEPAAHQAAPSTVVKPSKPAAKKVEVPKVAEVKSTVDYAATVEAKWNPAKSAMYNSTLIFQLLRSSVSVDQHQSLKAAIEAVAGRYARK